MTVWCHRAADQQTQGLQRWGVVAVIVVSCHAEIHSAHLLRYRRVPLFEGGWHLVHAKMRKWGLYSGSRSHFPIHQVARPREWWRGGSKTPRWN